ncbi:hypothetical protein FKM82_023879, partial [Ascaphus truei]
HLCLTDLVCLMYIYFPIYCYPNGESAGIHFLVFQLVNRSSQSFPQQHAPYTEKRSDISLFYIVYELLRARCTGPLIELTCMCSNLVLTHICCSFLFYFSGVSPRTDTAKWSPPENYKKRMAALETKQSQSKEVQRGPGAPHVVTDSRYRELSPEDRAIAERLDRLRQETKPRVVSSTAEIESRLQALRSNPLQSVPSAQEMEDRLAVLQGITPPSRAQRPV